MGSKRTTTRTSFWIQFNPFVIGERERARARARERERERIRVKEIERERQRVMEKERERDSDIERAVTVPFTIGKSTGSKVN